MDWTAPALVKWAYDIFDVGHVKSASDLDDFQSQSGGSVALGFFPRLCEGDAAMYYEALDLYKKRNGGEALPAAISTNVTFGREACNLPLKKKGGICILGDRGPRMSLPPEIKLTAENLSEWLEGILAPGKKSKPARSASKTEL